ncbi:vitamin B12 ABC transporter substrate-binding protein BtuF [Vibrio nereis]|uniref:Vitamin B12-binding protein n=1 Tax=Vibrio nereis TaxID=693 RepID=A0A0M0HKV4_VIBNE|nr:vitamin B12 ABC transporter substrate-binding protein BtuF [Vibrio nereis]KOO02393.1 Vitamin B12-binding protein [Vibrio nereis]
MRKLFYLLAALLPCSAISKPAERIVSLAPHATEIAFAAGLGDKLVAVSEHSDYPPAATQIEKVANYQGIKIERIIALQPDLILAWPSGNPAREIEKLKQFGLNIYYSHSSSLNDIAANIERLSQYADDPSVGESSAKKFRQSLQALKAKYHTEIPVRYFYQLSEQPIITVAQNNWPSEVFSFCGGVNIFEQSSAPYPQVSAEQVIVKQPEVIFTSEHAIKNGNMWQDWSEQLSAVKDGYIWQLNSDWLNRPTPRTLLAIEQVCNHLETVRQNR